MRRRTSIVRRWTEQEETALLRHVKAFPQNLSRCFIMVSDEIDRTPGAVANHWYTVTSKKPENIAYMFLTPSYVNRNRKNGTGEATPPSLWERVMSFIHTIFPDWRSA